METLSTRSLVVSGLTSGLTYNFRLIAHNENGPSQASSPTSITVCGDIGVFYAPVFSSANATSATIKWEPPLDTGGCRIANYSIFINDGEDGALPTSTDISTDGLTYSYTMTALSSLDLGKEYKVAITSESTGGRVGTSGVLRFTYALIPDPPSALTRDYSLSSESAIALRIDNTNSEGGSPIEEYEIYKQAGEGWAMVYSTIPTNALLYIDREQITKGATSLYKYRARNVAGWSDWSEGIL